MGGFAPLGTAAAGVTGAVGVLLTALAHVNSEMADLQRNAEFVGVTAERFQRIQFAAGQGGVSSSESVTDLRKVASLLSDAKENENSLTRLLLSVVTPMAESTVLNVQAERPSPQAVLPIAALSDTPLRHSVWMVSSQTVVPFSPRSQHLSQLRC